MNIKNYTLLAVLLVISFLVLLKESTRSDRFLDSHYKVMIVDGMQLTVKVDIYQKDNGEQRFVISNPIEIKSLKLDAIK